MTQHQINAIYKRLEKPSYKNLSSQEKKLIKYREQEAILEKDINATWKTIYHYQKPPYPPDTTPSHVLALLSEVLGYTSELEKVGRRKDKFIIKYGLDEDRIAHVFMLLQAGRHGGSF